MDIELGDDNLDMDLNMDTLGSSAVKESSGVALSESSMSAINKPDTGVEQFKSSGEEFDVSQVGDMMDTTGLDTDSSPQRHDSHLSKMIEKNKPDHIKEQDKLVEKLEAEEPKILAKAVKRVMNK